MKENKTKEILKRLRLNEILACYKEVARQAATEKWGHEEYLLELLEIEDDAKRRRRIERRERLSGLPSFKRLENYDRSHFEPNMELKIRDLLTGDFVSRNENLLIFGSPGTGKTHLAAGLGYELISKGKTVYFSLCSTLVQDLLKAKSELSLKRKLKQLSRYDAIIIDELGYIQQTRDEMEVLFTLLAERYETGTVIVTSNLPFSKWGEIFKDDMLAAAAIDRLVHHSVILKLDVENYRLRDRKQQLSNQEKASLNQ